VKTRDGKVATIYRMATDKLITDTEGAEGKKNIDWGSNELEKHSTFYRRASLPAAPEFTR
jgi:hypothetical protein